METFATAKSSHTPSYLVSDPFRKNSAFQLYALFLLLLPLLLPNMCNGLATSPSSLNQKILDDNKIYESPQELRRAIREKRFTSTTNGHCKGKIQCNLVVLPEKDAVDFLLFCQKNKQACPLIEVLDVGSYTPKLTTKPSVAMADKTLHSDCTTSTHSINSNIESNNEEDASFADLRTDLPQYKIYKRGNLVKETNDVIDFWPEDSVAFLIGCSFTIDAALIENGIHLRTVEQKTNVPMYNTNIPCTPAGKFKGNMVVSMKPIKVTDIAKEVLITSQYPHAHGEPVCIGHPESIGIDSKKLMEPDYGDPVEVKEDELPVFHCCGVTPQNVLLNCPDLDLVITHSPGCMFVTDLDSNTPP